MINAFILQYILNFNFSLLQNPFNLTLKRFKMDSLTILTQGKWTISIFS